MVNHFDIFGDFGNDTESFLDSFDNESDARAFARVRAGDPDCDYQAISVLEFDGSWLVNVVAEYQARPVRRPVWDRVADLWADVQRSRDVETVTIAVCFIAVLMVFLKC